MMLWRLGTMSEVMAEFYDGPHATPKPVSAGGVYLGIKNLTDSGHLDLSQVRFIAEHDMPKWTKRVTPRGGDIVFSYEATLHRYAVIPSGFHGTLGRRLALIRVAKDVMRRDFLLYTFLSPQWRRVIESRMNIGSTVDRIPLTEFPDYPIAIPPLEAQDAIVHVLRGFDDLIKNNRRRIEILEEIARLLYLEWFVHFRFPGHEDVELVDSELGPIPEGWVASELGDVIELKRGYDLPAKRRSGGPFPVVSSSGITGSHAESKVQPPGVVTGRYGTIGRVFYLNEPFWPLNTSLYVCDFKGNSARWVAALLRSLDLEGMVAAAAVPGVNRNHLHKMMVVVPDIDVVNEFDAVLDPMIDLRFNMEAQNRVLREVRDLLLPRLVSGELDMSELEQDGDVT